MATFASAYAMWRAEPFPPGSTCDDLDELHADLALIDTWVADTVVPYAERGARAQTSKVDIKHGIEGLAERLDSLSRKDSDPQSATLVAAYERYLALTADVLEAYERTASHGE